MRLVSGAAALLIGLVPGMVQSAGGAEVATQPPGSGNETGTGARSDKAEQVQARLIAEGPAVPGQTVHVAVTFEIKAGWHLYWDGDNESGMPPEVEWRLPAGWKAGAVQWPAPKRHLSHGDILDYTHEDVLTLIVPVAVPADAKPGVEVEISASLRWLVCSSVCVPGSAEVSMKVPVRTAAEAGKPTTGGSSADAKLFEAARAEHPKPVKMASAKGEAEGLKWSWDGTKLEISAEGASRMEFMVASSSRKLENPSSLGARTGSTMRLRFEPAKSAAADEGGAGAGVRGVLVVTRGGQAGGGKLRWEKFWIDLPDALVKDAGGEKERREGKDGGGGGR